MALVPAAAMVTSSAALQELHTRDARSVLDALGTLSPIGIGEIVDLPRIIVVGARSAGKSSVLQAISGIQFPTRDNVCTRFATEVVTRTGTVSSIKASIRYHDKSKEDHQVQVDGISLNYIDLIISQAKEDMGLSDDIGFCKDVLRIDIAGPDFHPLMLVDLPAMYGNAADEDSGAGKKLVEDLACSYMQQSNSIILAVVAANEQLASQGILELVSQCDPRKERTIGVITKPDLLQRDSVTRLAYLNLLHGKTCEHRLKLGWHLLRNWSGEDTKPDIGQEDALEAAFFRTDDWPSVSPLNRGAPTLRKRISHVLYELVKQTLPGILRDIETQLNERGEELSQLGTPRSTAQEVRAYLIDIASRFQQLVDDSVEGNYHDPLFTHVHERRRKLRAQLRRFNRVIRQVLIAHGSTYIISSGEQATMSGLSVADRYGKHMIQDMYGTLPTSEVISSDELSLRLRRQGALNQGTELPGLPSKALVSQLFRERSLPWKDIAERHVRAITVTAQDFVEDIIRYCVGSSDMNTMSFILATYVRPFFNAQEEILDAKLQEILLPFQQGYVFPLDDEYQEKLQSLRAGRTLPGAGDRAAGPGDGKQIKNSNDEYDAAGVIDAMQVLYQISLRSFTENLINLVIESCLVRRLRNILTPRLVNEIDNAGLETFVSEMRELSERRNQLAKDIDLLKAARRECRSHIPRSRRHEAETGTIPRAPGTATSAFETSLVNNAAHATEESQSGSAVPLPNALHSSSQTAQGTAPASNVTESSSSNALSAGAQQPSFGAREVSSGAGISNHVAGLFGNVVQPSVGSSSSGQFSTGPNASQTNTSGRPSMPAFASSQGGPFSGGSGSAAGPQQTGGNIFSR